jgi:hypothetical protein
LSILAAAFLREKNRIKSFCQVLWLAADLEVIRDGVLFRR